MALAVVGVLMSFPVKAEAVEKNPFWRRVTAWTCIVLGVSGLVVSAHQRHESESRLETVAANTKTAVDELSALVTKTNALVSDNNNLVSLYGLLTTQVVSVSDRLSDLEPKIEAAKEKHDPQELATLQAQAKSQRELLDGISKDFLQLQAVRIANQLRGWELERSAAEQNMRFQKYLVFHEHRLAGDELKKSDAGWDEKIKASNDAFFERLREIIANADALRMMMLRKIPPSALTPDDMRWDAAFLNAKKNPRSLDLNMAADYLVALAGRLGA